MKTISKNLSRRVNRKKIKKKPSWRAILKGCYFLKKKLSQNLSWRVVLCKIKFIKSFTESYLYNELFSKRKTSSDEVFYAFIHEHFYCVLWSISKVFHTFFHKQLSLVPIKCFVIHVSMCKNFSNCTYISIVFHRFFHQYFSLGCLPLGQIGPLM